MKKRLGAFFASALMLAAVGCATADDGDSSREGGGDEAIGEVQSASKDSCVDKACGTPCGLPNLKCDHFGRCVSGPGCD